MAVEEQFLMEEEFGAGGIRPPPGAVRPRRFAVIASTPFTATRVPLIQRKPIGGEPCARQ